MASRQADEIIQLKRISFQDLGTGRVVRKEIRSAFSFVREMVCTSVLLNVAAFLLVSEFSPGDSCGHLLDEAAHRRRRGLEGSLPGVPVMRRTMA